MHRRIKMRLANKRVYSVLLAVSLAAGTVMPAFAEENGSAEESTQVSAEYSTEVPVQEEESTTEESTAEESTAEETVSETETAQEPEIEGETQEGEQISEQEAEAPREGEQISEQEVEEAPQVVEEEPTNDETAKTEIPEAAEEDNGASENENTPEEGTTLDLVKVTIHESEGGDDNEELFEQYVDRLFNGEHPSAGPRLKAKKRTGDRFSGTSAMIYSELLSGIQEVAAGQRQSTQFEFSAANLGYEDSVTWGASDLGVTEIVVDGEIVQEAVDKTAELYEQELQIVEISNTLLADCPYELYWYDKTAGIDRNIEVGATYVDGEWRTFVGGTYTISYAVAEEFALSVYAADTEKTGAASTAVGNAQSILASNEGLSDVDKLYAYKDAICDLVSYNHDAADNDAAYGNPWQLIWVFDGDPSTNVVCEGYSKAFQYLCDETDFSNDRICAYSVSGTMVGGTGEGAHMWNIVTLDDGRNYLADVTNSDSETVGQAGELFLTPYTSGSVEEGYIFRCDDEISISYIYNDYTRSLFSAKELTISSTPYGTMPVLEPLEITTQPQDVEAEIGDRVSFTVATNKTDAAYQWQWSKNGTEWTDCTSGGCNTDTFSFTMKRTLDGRLYRCIVTFEDESVESDAASITLQAVEPLEITTQPQDAEAEIGDQVSFTVKANKSDAAYQWQWSKNGTTWANCSSAGFNTDTFGFKMRTQFDGRLYRCAVSSGNETVYSDAARITLPSDEPLEITTQPQDVEAEAGDQVSFTVVANKTGAAYQWQWSKNGTTWTNCASAGYNTDTFGFKMRTQFNGRLYRCVVSKGDETVYSDSAAVLIPNPIKITEQPRDNVADIGEIVSFHVEANLTDAAYQWQWSNNKGATWNNCTSAGSKTDTFSFSMKKLMDGRYYRCAVSYGTYMVYSDEAQINLPIK